MRAETQQPTIGHNGMRGDRVHRDIIYYIKGTLTWAFGTVGSAHASHLMT